MQLIVDIKNEKIADKIIGFLKSFQDKGVEILNKEENNLTSKKRDEKFAKENWKEVIMNTHSSDIDDDEYLYEAAWEFYNEKHSD